MNNEMLINYIVKCVQSEHQQRVSNLQCHLEKIEKFDNLDWIVDNNYMDFFCEGMDYAQKLCG